MSGSNIGLKIDWLEMPDRKRQTDDEMVLAVTDGEKSYNLTFNLNKEGEDGKLRSEGPVTFNPDKIPQGVKKEEFVKWVQQYDGQIQRLDEVIDQVILSRRSFEQKLSNITRIENPLRQGVILFRSNLEQALGNESEAVRLAGHVSNDSQSDVDIGLAKQHDNLMFSHGAIRMAVREKVLSIIVDGSGYQNIEKIDGFVDNFLAQISPIIFASFVEAFEGKGANKESRINILVDGKKLNHALKNILENLKGNQSEPIGRLVIGEMLNYLIGQGAGKNINRDVPEVRDVTIIPTYLQLENGDFHIITRLRQGLLNTKQKDIKAAGELEKNFRKKTAEKKENGVAQKEAETRVNASLLGFIKKPENAISVGATAANIGFFGVALASARDNGERGKMLVGAAVGGAATYGFLYALDKLWGIRFPGIQQAHFVSNGAFVGGMFSASGFDPGGLNFGEGGVITLPSTVKKQNPLSMR